VERPPANLEPNTLPRECPNLQGPEQVGRVVTTNAQDRADRVAAAGLPYPYPSPLPSDVRKAHEQAARRAWESAAKLGAYLGIPATLALIVGGAWRSGPGLLLLVGGAAGLAVVLLVGIPRGRRLERHRAVLTAYGIATDNTGAIRPSSRERAARARRAAIGTDLRAEARRALRVYRATLAVCTALVIGNAVLSILALGPVDDDQGLAAAGVVSAAVIGLVIGTVLSRALRKVRVASEEKLTFPYGVGFLVFVLGIATGVFAGEAVHSVNLDRETARPASGYVTSCNSSGRRTMCHGVWDVDGHVYSGEVPFDRADIGRRVEFDVSTNDPGIVTTQEDGMSKRLRVWGWGMLAIAIAAVWQRMARTSLRKLRTAAGVQPG
jgi:hypothetical protein